MFRLHRKQLVDFTPGRPTAAKTGGKGESKGLPHSRWVRSNGKFDQVVICFKKNKQKTM